MAFYEAVRVKALERINKLNQSEDKNTKRFRCKKCGLNQTYPF